MGVGNGFSCTLNKSEHSTLNILFDNILKMKIFNAGVTTTKELNYVLV